MPERTLLGGTDGFRGMATFDPGPGLVNPETFAGATYALIGRQLELGMTGPLVVSRDTRPSGVELRQAVIAGALMHGVDVWDLGIAPTPAAQKTAREIGAIATVVVTASHNLRPDNGWKGMTGSDKPLKPVVEDISRRYWEQVENGLVIPIDTVEPEKYAEPELLKQYEDKVVQDIVREFGEAPLEGKILVVDGAYGAAQKVTPDVLRRLGAVVEEFCCDDGGDINEGCGAANLNGLKKFLTTRPELTSSPNFMGAIANDGDADRMMAVGVISDGHGGQEFVNINGNHVMGVLAQGEPGIVGTEYTNSGLVRKLHDQGIDFAYCANGDVNVTQKLREKQVQGSFWRRGGEFTGHHVDTDWLSSGDGVRMAAWFASYASTHEITFGQVHQELPLWAEKMEKVEFPDVRLRKEIQQDPLVVRTIAKAEEEMGELGRLILRPSGTEPVVRIWGEGENEEQICRIVGKLAAFVQYLSR